MNLKGVIIVITGAAGGLGKELAIQCKAVGAVVIISDKDEAKLYAAAEELGVRGIVADVTNENSIAVLAKTVHSDYGRIDIWINNAGIWLPHAGIEALDTARMQKVFAVNTFGTIYGSRDAFIIMSEQGKGTIINISSVSGLEPHFNSAVYCASKYAVTGFTKALRLEAAPLGVQVLGVYPDKMKTALFDEQPPADYDTYLSPMFVADMIIKNLQKTEPEADLIIRQG